MVDLLSANYSVPSGPATVSSLVIEPLRQTKGWARFLSILGIILSGLMVVGGLLMMLGTIIGFSAFSSASSSSSSGSGLPIWIGAAPMLVVGIVYIGFALLYLIPSLWLFRYANRIGDLLSSQSEMDLVAALHAQKSFWKFLGIMCLVGICCYALLIIGMIVMAAGGMMSAPSP